MSLQPLTSSLSPEQKPLDGDLFDQLSQEMHQAAPNGHSTQSTLARSSYSTTPPCSPEKTFSFTTVPPTPCKPKESLGVTSETEAQLKLEERENDSFPNPLPLLPETNQNLKHLSPPINNFSFKQNYRSTDGTPHSLIKQCTKKGCGPTVLLMLWADMHRDSESLPKIHGRFWEIVSHCTGASHDLVQLYAEKWLNIKLESQNQIRNMDQIRNLLDESGQPVLASIDHPKLGGHWILIDHVNLEEKQVDIRDPYTGKAYRVSFDEAQEWLNDGTGLCLYIAPEDNT